MLVSSRNQQVIRDSIEKIIVKNGFTLFDFKIINTGRGITLRVLVDYAQGGIDLHECARLNFKIRKIIEGENYFSEDINIEVFSPGADRDLKQYKDFLRVKNRVVKVWFKDKKEGILKVKEIAGELKEVKNSGIEIMSKTGPREIFFADIQKARQVL